MKLVLPYPVSENRYWRSFVPKGWTRAVVTLSPEAKAYKAEVGYLAKLAGYRVPTLKPIEVGSITLCPRQNKDGSASATVLDLMNAWKVVGDALEGIVYVNDKQIKRVRGPIEYGPPTEKGAYIVEFVDFVPAPVGLFSEPITATEILASRPSAWPAP